MPPSFSNIPLKAPHSKTVGLRLSRLDPEPMFSRARVVGSSSSHRVRKLALAFRSDALPLARLESWPPVLATEKYSVPYQRQQLLDSQLCRPCPEHPVREVSFRLQLRWEPD